MEQVLWEFEEMTKDAERVQRDTLRRILEENASAEYLRNLGLDGRTDLESYMSCVPLITYRDLEAYFHRMVDGDISSILTRKPITKLSMSSGTTEGKRKVLPFNDELMETTLQTFCTSFAFRNREYPVEKGKALLFNYGSKPFKTKGGLLAGTATSHVFRNSGYRTTMKAFQTESCSPNEVVFCSDFRQSLYCHLLCGLIFRDEIQMVFSSFAHSIVLAFRTFEQVWEELCDNLREGVLSSRITDSSIRTAMSKILDPNPQLAGLIYKKCTGLSNWYGLIPALFPNIKYVYGIMTGSMEPYAKKLRHYSGEIPLISADYGSSEGWIGANINPGLPPEEATFVVLPSIGYFEFIPVRDNAEGICVKPVGLTDVKIGEEYEIVITSVGGLYRYKLGDIVKVVGFHNTTPEIKFMGRSDILLTINVDKSTEKDLQLAVEEAAKLLAEEKLEVVDFSSFVELSKDPGHYVIFWEISGEPSDEVLKQCCNCLDKSFSDGGYVGSRKINTIGPLELRVVRTGTFQKILEYFVGLGGTVNQLKTPRCVGPAKNKMVLEILCDNVAKTYTSTAYD